MLRRAALLVLISVLLGEGVFPARGAQAAKGVDGVVNLNTAGAEVLALLPGVGPSKAAAILAYRHRRPFRTVDELVRIKGIGRKMVRRLRPHLAIAGPTTATVARAPSASAPPGPPKPPPPPAHGPGALHCPPPHATRPARSPAREHGPARPFSAPCLGPR